VIAKIVPLSSVFLWATVSVTVGQAPPNTAATPTISVDSGAGHRGGARIARIQPPLPVSVDKGQSGIFPLSGRVMNGAVGGATARFYKLNANGTKGPLLGSAVTDVNGFYLVSFVSKSSDSILAESSGGKYRDEVTGVTVALSTSDTLAAVFPARAAAVAVTPLSNMAAARARVLAAGGEPLSTAVSAANAGVGEQYQIPDIIQLLPVAADSASEVRTSTRDQRDYGLVLAGIAQEAHSLGVRAIDLAEALATDASDGILDGKVKGSPVTIAGSGPAVETAIVRLVSAPLTVNAGTSGVQTGINTFIGGAQNKTGLDVFEILNQPVTIGPNGPYVTGAVLPAARSGKAYGAGPLSVAGGTPPYAWAFAAGSAHPAWLGLTPGGAFGGNAPVLPPGTKVSISPVFVATVSDTSHPVKKVNVPLTMTVTALPPEIHTMGGQCFVDQFCQLVVATADGGNPPFAFFQDSLAYGGLPIGMHLDASGTVSGTPTRADHYPFGVCVTDVIGTETCDHDPTIIVTDVSISPTSASFAASGGGGSVTVHAPDGEPWTAVSNDAWIAITSVSGGSGDGTVGYSVESNSTASPRLGTLTIAGLTFTITQNGPTTEFPFDGAYSGNAIGTSICPGSSGPVNVQLAFTVSFGYLSMTDPFGGSGTVSNSGSTTFGDHDCSFTGTFVVNGSSIQASGNWSCPNVACGSGSGSESGTWSVSKQ